MEPTVEAAVGTRESVPTAAALTRAIMELREEWLASGEVPDVRAIGQGRCYDFAEAVMLRLGVDGHGRGWMPEDSHGRLIDCVTDDWWRRMLDDAGDDAGEAETFVMDLPRLRREGAPLSDILKDDDEEYAAVLGSMTHDWLVLDGRHYDATCPEGADHFLLLPFFADQTSAYERERMASGTAPK
jgi:hypothetical protein